MNIGDQQTLRDVYNEIDNLPEKIAPNKGMILEFLTSTAKPPVQSTSSAQKTTNVDIKSIIKKTLDTNHNKPVIFTGAPGTGKTYAVREYVKEKCGDDESRYKFVQFHPSYDYTDFVEGLRPVQLNGSNAPTFVRLDGTFKAFCRQIVESERKVDYYFIIDEINRADLPKVFGELMFGIEEDYREEKFDTQYQNLPTYQVDPKTKQVTLLTNDEFNEGFYIPQNLHIIGTMNDIDRSVDSIDFALRRRFLWVEIKANEIMSTSLRSMLNGKLTSEEIENLAERIKSMNKVISGEKGESGKKFYLTEAYHIGPAYFKNIESTSEEELEKIFNSNITSILKEYTRGRDAKSVEKFIEECRNELLPTKGDTTDGSK